MELQKLTWKELNEALLNTEDEELLDKWLREALQTKLPAYRVLRIHGRLGAVRRKREIEQIRKMCA